MRKTFKKVMATLTAATLAFAMATTLAPATADALTSKAGKKAAKAEFDPAGTYHAYFGFQQTGSWIFRDEWCSDTLGIGGSSLKEVGLEYDCGTLLQSGTDGLVQIEGTTVTDAEITGNGVYSVGVEGLNGSLATDTESVVSMIYCNTDIPLKAKDNPVVISDWKLEIDGSEVTLPEEIFFPSEYNDASGLIRFDAVNTYQSDKGEYPGAPTIMTPQDSIKITFTVSGMANDNPDAVEATEAPAEDPAAATTTADDADDNKGGSALPIVIAVVAVVVIAGVVVVVVKKKNS